MPQGKFKSTSDDVFISMEFLPSFLRHHFAGKPAVASRNVGRFLSLTFPRNDHNLHYLYKKLMIMRQTDKFLHRHLVISSSLSLLFRAYSSSYHFYPGFFIFDFQIKHKCNGALLKAPDNAEEWSILKTYYITGGHTDDCIPNLAPSS